MKKVIHGFFLFLVAALFTEVSAQSSYTFTTAGATGKTGPTQAQLDAAYAAPNSLAGAVTSSNGIQLWTVPATGFYQIAVTGAQGGSNPDPTRHGGYGARMVGDFNLTAGEVIQVLVGQEGGATVGVEHYGGGGGSFVVTSTNTCLIAAGGGGGAGGTGGGPGVDASIGLDGLAGVSGGTGGLNGNGGFAPTGNGGAGAGFLTDGTSNSGCCGTANGIAFLNGGQGGQYVPGNQSEGGFGGAGSGWHSTGNGGGGGGWSGGGTNGSNPYLGGGGGGSLNTGVNQTNTAGVGIGDGQVIITALSSPAPNNTGATMIVNPSFVDNTVCAGISQVDVIIQNFGSNQINSLDIEWTYDGVPQPTVSYASLLDTFGGVGNTVDTVNLGTINVTGNSEIIAWTTMPNGNMDTVNTNDTTSLAIDSVITTEFDLGPDKVACDGNFIILENTSPSNQVYNSYNWSTGASTPTIITNQPGTYSLTVTYGPPQCVSADQIVVTTADNPVITLGEDTILCANEYVLDAGEDGATFAWSDGTSTQTNTVTNSGNYSVTVTNSEGCISEEDINLTLLETPVVDLGANFKLCISFNQTQLLSAGNSFDSYLWSTGATTPNIVVGAGVTTVGNQTYSVTVTGDNGCEGEDAVVVEYSQCVGIDEDINNSNVSLFPNPANDLVTFTAENTEMSEVQIFDLTGKMIYTNYPVSNRLEVNTSAFASGTYIVKVITENNAVTRRLIIQ